MIPRFKPYMGKEELLAAFGRQENTIGRFEEEFARTFEAKYALAFPYGPSALWGFFKAFGIEGAEVIMPACTLCGGSPCNRAQQQHPSLCGHHSKRLLH